MINQPSITLFSTDACHLCELAQQVVAQSKFSGKLVIADIIDQPHWFECYQVRIPVLHYRGHELDWPFDVTEVNRFLQQLSTPL